MLSQYMSYEEIALRVVFAEKTGHLTSLEWNSISQSLQNDPFLCEAVFRFPPMGSRFFGLMLRYMFTASLQNEYPISFFEKYENYGQDLLQKFKVSPTTQERTEHVLKELQELCDSVMNQKIPDLKKEEISWSLNLLESVLNDHRQSRELLSAFLKLMKQKFLKNTADLMGRTLRDILSDYFIMNHVVAINVSLDSRLTKEMIAIQYQRVMKLIVAWYIPSARNEDLVLQSLTKNLIFAKNIHQTIPQNLFCAAYGVSKNLVSNQSEILACMSKKLQITAGHLQLIVQFLLKDAWMLTEPQRDAEIYQKYLQSNDENCHNLSWESDDYFDLVCSFLQIDHTSRYGLIDDQPEVNQILFNNISQLFEQHSKKEITLDQLVEDLFSRLSDTQMALFIEKLQHQNKTLAFIPILQACFEKSVCHGSQKTFQTLYQKGFSVNLEKQLLLAYKAVNTDSPIIFSLLLSSLKKHPRLWSAISFQEIFISAVEKRNVQILYTLINLLDVIAHPSFIYAFSWVLPMIEYLDEQTVLDLFTRMMKTVSQNDRIKSLSYQQSEIVLKCHEKNFGHFLHYLLENFQISVSICMPNLIASFQPLFFQMLIQHHAIDLNICIQGYTPIFWALIQQRYDALEMICQHSSTLMTCTEKRHGDTPLHFAIRQHSLVAAQKILDSQQTEQKKMLLMQSTNHDGLMPHHLAFILRDFDFLTLFQNSLSDIKTILDPLFYQIFSEHIRADHHDTCSIRLFFNNFFKSLTLIDRHDVLVQLKKMRSPLYQLGFDAKYSQLILDFEDIFAQDLSVYIRDIKGEKISPDFLKMLPILACYFDVYPALCTRLSEKLIEYQENIDSSVFIQLNCMKKTPHVVFDSYALRSHHSRQALTFSQKSTPNSSSKKNLSPS